MVQRREEQIRRDHSSADDQDVECFSFCKHLSTSFPRVLSVTLRTQRCKLKILTSQTAFGLRCSFRIVTEGRRFNTQCRVRLRLVMRRPLCPAKSQPKPQCFPFVG